MIEEDSFSSIENKKIIKKKSPKEVYVIQNDEIKYTNVSNSTFSGYSIDELKNIEGPALSNLVHPEDVEFVMEQEINKSLGNEKVITTYPFRIVTKTGKIKKILISSRTIRYKGEKANLVILNELDHTNKTTLKLNENEKNLQKFENLLEIIHGLCLLINLGFKNTEINFWLGLENLNNLYSLLKEMILDNNNLELVKNRIEELETDVEIGEKGDFFINFKKL